MNGHNMTIVGPTCVSDLDRCVFVYIDPTIANYYETGSYELLNCNPTLRALVMVSPVVVAVGLV
jgi:hypothetical protein